MMTHHDSIQERILSAIKTGKFRMYSKGHFVWRAVLVGVGGMLLLLTLLYLAGFILFILRTTGVLFTPAFGLRGWLVFFVNLPWLLIALVVFFVVALEILVRRYSFAYRRPLLYSAIGILILVIVGGHVLARTALRGHFARYGERGRSSFTRELYRHYGEARFRGIHPGTIIQMQSDGFTLQTRRGGERLQVIVTEHTRWPGRAAMETGDRVMVFGQRRGDRVEAFGIRNVSERLDERNYRRRLYYEVDPGKSNNL